VATFGRSMAERIRLVKGALLWMLGIPLPMILLIYLLGLMH
jgi:hypothetical protein